MSEPDATVGALDEQSLPMCRSGWRGQLIALGVVAAVVLGFALNLHFGMANVPDWSRRMFQGGKAGPDGAGPWLPVAGQTATFPAENLNFGDPGGEAQVSNLHQVGTSLRTSFNQAARTIRPATLAVRAVYGVDPIGKVMERIGSAVVVDSTGYAVTCNHVVVGATTISIRRFREPERWSPAKVIAVEDDLALMKASDESPFVAATFADSNKVRVGDWVLAAGHPFQLGTTVSAGIVSRRDSALTLPGGRQYTGLLQTDAAINEGSSGGPLVNLNGEVVGINAAIYAPSGVFSGASFAISSNRVRDFVAKNLGMRVETAPVAWGLGLATMTPALAQRLACPLMDGVVVSQVTPESAAANAQIVEGDVILSIAGEPVPDLAAAQRIRERVQTANAVPVEVWRGGARRQLTLQLGKS